MPSVTLGTIHRNLSWFADSWLIRRVKRVEGASFFEGNTKPHNHAICERCEKVEDLVFSNLKDLVSSPISGSVVSVDLTVNCICPECAGKEALAKAT
ncbi:MAG: transcriptional repressor [Clostridiales bacterium]|jgi:Fe2+ or Zn2+ uptake regulation protein|nr:transcriptional repressor [Clostridiales bacterium]